MTNSKDKTLDELIGAAPKEIAPAQDAWQGIAERLDRPQPAVTSKKPLWALAVAAALMLALLPLLPRQETAPAGDDSLLPLIASIELAHQQEVKALSSSAEAGWQMIGYREPVDKGLNELREAAQLILNALKANPHDKQLWQLWLWVQRREIELLTQGQKWPSGTTQGDTL